MLTLYRRARRGMRRATPKRADTKLIQTKGPAYGGEGRQIKRAYAKLYKPMARRGRKRVTIKGKREEKGDQ